MKSQNAPVILLAVLACTLPSSAQVQDFPSQTLGSIPSTANTSTAWNKAGADEGLRQAFERAMYSLEESGNGTYRGVNRAQRLTLEFDGQEARLSHPDGSVNFHLTG